MIEIILCSIKNEFWGFHFFEVNIIYFLYNYNFKRDKGSASWQKSQKPLQIRTGVYRTVPPEPHERLSNRYFQIIVIYLGFKITFYIFATETDN